MTSPSPDPRPDRPEAGPLFHARLFADIERLQSERAWTAGDRNAITLTKGGGLTLVLTVLRAGAVLREHRAPAAASVHVVGGRMRLEADGRALELTAGDVVTLSHGLPHSVRALEDAAFLLTIVERVDR